MPSNIEMKAKIDDPDRLKARIEDIATEPSYTVYQEDIFFDSKTGRLKLRTLSDGSGELIYYERPDTTDAKQSDYQIYRTSKPMELRKVLKGALNSTVTVEKLRQVFIVGHTRIHLDEVESLGTYMELEVVLKPGQTAKSATRIAKELMIELGVQDSDLIGCAYADLIMNKSD